MKKKKVKLIISGSLIVLITAFIVTAVFIYFNSNKLVIKNANLYSIVGGSASWYTGDVTLQPTGEDGVELRSSAITLPLDATPIYYKDQKKILLPKNMEIVQYREDNKMFKLNRYVTIEQVDGVMRIKDNSFETVKTNFFLFDGKNTYVFFEDTTITYGNSKVTIPAFSYVTNVYNNKLSVYNYETGEYREFPVANMEVVAELEDGNSINLNTDTFRASNQQQTLLIKQIENLKNLE